MPNSCVLATLALVVVVLVSGKHMMIGCFDPQGLTRADGSMRDRGEQYW